MFYRGPGAWSRLIALFLAAGPRPEVRFEVGWYVKDHRRTVRTTIRDNTVELPLDEARALGELILQHTVDAMPLEIREEWEVKCCWLGRTLIAAADQGSGKLQ